MKPISSNEKQGRNDLCLCGSGKKYKKCCLLKEQARGTQHVPSIGARNEANSVMTKMAKIIEVKSKKISIEELNHYFTGKSFDEIHAEYESIKENNSKSDAEVILNEVYEADAITKRIALAEKAIAIYPGLPDAWCILAHEKAKTSLEAIAYFEQAIEAGKADLGEKYFEDNEGHFWGMIESRPYMRAKAYLADAFIEMKRYDKAIFQFEDCIKLNPNDNQGIRNELLALYLQLNRMKDAEKLLRKYKEDFGASWDFGKVLYLFKKEGPDSFDTIKLLNQARKNNPFVPQFLLGKKKLPKPLPDSYATGSKEEAILYVTESSLAWVATPGALEWLGHWT